MRYKVYLAILFCLFICDSSRGRAFLNGETGMLGVNTRILSTGILLFLPISAI